MIICNKCNTQNEDGRHYCISCKAFLECGEAFKSRSKSVWEMIASAGYDNIQPTVPNGIAHNTYISYQNIIQHTTSLPKKEDYVPREFRKPSDASDTGNAQSVNSVPRRSPMGPAKVDNSSLRLICKFPNGSTRIIIPDKNGVTIGKSGFAGLHEEFQKCKMVADKHIFVSHSPTGWYMSVLDVNVSIDGDNKSVGTQQPLRNNSLILLGECEIRVELI